MWKKNQEQLNTSIIFSWNFSQTLGTPKKIVGRASLRVKFNDPLSAFLSAKYVVPLQYIKVRALGQSLMYKRYGVIPEQHDKDHVELKRGNV